MELKKPDAMLFDIGFHVVELNKYLDLLNRYTRQTYKPDYEMIDNLATEIRHHSAMIQKIVGQLA